MTVEIATLGVDFDTGRLRIGADELKRLGAAANKAADDLDNTGARSKRSVDGMSAAFRQLQGVVAALGLIQLTRQVIAVSDEYAKITGRLKLVTDGTADLALVQEELFQIAQRTGSAYEGVAALYTKVARNAEELGLSQAQMLRITEATNQAIQIGGASAQEAAAGVQQFSQALASGELRGDEFRSVLENMPRLAQAISDALGVNIGDLRKLAADGQLSAQAVTQALLGQSAQLEAEFSQLPVTVGRAMQELENEVKRAIAGADMTPLVDSIRDLREEISDPATVQGLATFAGGLATIAEVLVSITAGLAGVTRYLAESAAAAASGPAIGDAVRLMEEIEAIESRIETARQRGGDGSNSFYTQAVERMQAEKAALEGLLSVTNQATEAASKNAAAVSAAAGAAENKTDIDLKAAAALKAAKDAQDKAADAIRKANASAERQVATLQIQLGLMAKGLTAEEAGTRAAMAANGVRTETIDQTILLERALKSATDAQRDFTAAVDQDRQESIEAESRLRSEEAITADLRLRLELMQRGVSAAEAEYEVQVRRLAISGDQAAIDQLILQRRINSIAETQAAAEQAANDVQRDWERAADDINRSLTDALLRGFEAGKNFAENFIDTLKNLFQTLVLRPVIEFIVSPITGLIQGVLGSIGSAVGGSLLGMIPGLAGMSLGGVASGFAGGALSGFGGGLGAISPNPAQAAGFGFGSSAIGAGLIGGLGGFAVGSLLEGSDRFSQNTSTYAGAGGAIGGAVGSVVPVVGTFLGAAIGTAIGGLIGGIEGRWKLRTQELGISLADGVVDATITSVFRKKNIVGSTKRRTITDDATELDDALSEVFGLIFDNAGSAAEALGVSLEGFTYEATQSIKGLEGAELDAAITAMLEGASEALAERIIPNFREYQREGESAAQTLGRLTGETVYLRQAMDSLGGQVGNLGMLLTVDLAQQLAEVAGGFDVLAANLNTFYESFYSETERSARAAELLTESVAELGFSLPGTRDGFRALVTGLDLTTEAGREAYAALLALSGQADAFYDAAEQAAQEATEARERELEAAREATRAAIEMSRRRADFERDISEQLTASRLQGIELELFAARQQYQQQLRDARELGASVAGIEALYGQRRLQIVEEYADQARQAIRTAYDRQAQDLQQTIDKFRSFSQALSAFRQELDTGPLALLTPQQQYEALRTQFDDTRALAAVGDETALAALEQVSREFLDASQAVNASSAAYLTDLDAVRAAVDLAKLAADVEVDIGQMQLDTLTEQVSKLVELNQSVQSVEEAIRALEDLEAQGARFSAGGSATVAPVTSSGSRLVSPKPLIVQRDSSEATQAAVSAALTAVQATLERITGAKIPLNLTVVTPDGKVLKQEVRDDIRESSRRGELVVFAEGVAGNRRRR